ncbi:hypothetical protein PTKIN_Ptkin11bG0031800 [Pterospermum kingtungense]
MDFFFIDTDDAKRLNKVLWVHPRCRVAYEEFNDVVAFDITYLVNRYKMPFATIVEINHHGQSIILGCALISNEDVYLFKRVFTTWLSSMRDIHPTAILIDQCESIRGAIRQVMPNMVHQFCLRHIMCKLPEKFKHVNDFNGTVKKFKALVYDSLTIEENWDMTA